jgi:hypothetical protein
LALENILVHLATLGFRFCCRIFARTRQQFVDANDKPFVSGDALPVFIIHRRLEILVKEPYAIHDAPAPESGRLADDTAALELLELKLARIVFADNIAVFINIVGRLSGRNRVARNQLDSEPLHGHAVSARCVPSDRRRRLRLSRRYPDWEQLTRPGAHCDSPSVARIDLSTRWQWAILG